MQHPKPRHVAIGTLPRPRHACSQGQDSPMGTQPTSRQAAKAKVAPMGMLPRPWQPYEHTTKAKACSSQGQGTSQWAHFQGQGMHVAKAKEAPWSRSQGQDSPMGMQLRPRHATPKAKARRHRHVAKAKAAP
nr:hypothetical protein CFP56_45731 [Quercus suber]